MLSRNPKLIAFVIIILLLGALFVPALLAPGIAERTLRTALVNTGFDLTRLGTPRTSFNAILFSDIPLDDDAISSIDAIKVTFDPYSLLLTGQLGRLTITGLDLNGSWENDNLDSLSFTGWNAKTSLSDLPFQSFRQISLEKARISVLTAKAGILSAHLDLTINRNGTQADFQTTIKSEQKFLSFAITGSGLIEKNRWLAELEIPEAKFEDPDGAIKATRMHGNAMLTVRKGEPLSLNAELFAGGLQTYGLPWHNASATLEHTDGIFKILSEAESINNPDIELELNLSNPDGRWLKAGGFHAARASDLIAYLADHPAYKPLVDELKAYQTQTDISANFASTQDSASVYSYSIENSERSVLGAGTLTVPESNAKP